MKNAYEEHEMCVLNDNKIMPHTIEILLSSLWLFMGKCCFKLPAT